MTGNSTLKIAASISLGIHLLFLGFASSLFQAPKVLRTPAHYVRVTLLPIVNTEKPDTNILPPVPLKVGNQDRKEPGSDIKELNHEPLPYKSGARDVPLEEWKLLEEQKPVEEKKSLEQKKLREEPKPVSDQKEEEISNVQMDVAMASGSVSDIDAILKSEGNMGSAK